MSSQQVIMTWNLSKLKLTILQTKSVVSFNRIDLNKLENDYAYWQILTLVWPSKRPRDIAFIPSILKRVQSWQISWIRHLHISHNAGLMCRPKFSRDGCNTQEKWKTKVMQNLGGQMRCFMGHVQVANTGSNQNIRGKKNARYIRIHATLTRTYRHWINQNIPNWEILDCMGSSPR